MSRFGVISCLTSANVHFPSHPVVVFDEMTFKKTTFRNGFKHILGDKEERGINQTVINFNNETLFIECRAVKV